jgi:hypothetical protein
MNLKNVFVGVPQSKYAGIAVLIALIAASISILFGKDKIPLGQKIGAILLLLIVSVPGILYSLFQVTCLASGAGSRNQRWWCSVYAWIISVLVVIYSVLLVAVAIMSIFSNSSLINDLSMKNVENFEDSMAMANKIVGAKMGVNVNANTEDENTKSFEGNKVSDRDSTRSKVLGGSDTPLAFPYSDGTLNPTKHDLEGFASNVSVNTRKTCEKNAQGKCKSQ